MNNIEIMIIRGVLVILAGAIRNAKDQDPSDLVENLLDKNETIIEMVSKTISRDQIKSLLVDFLKEVNR